MTNDNSPDDATTDGIARIKNTARDQLRSRRGFLAGTAAIGGTALVGSGGAVGGNLQEDGEDNGSDGSNGSDEGDGGEDETSDVDILNYALTLEHLEAEFYKMGLEDFSDKELMNADTVCNRLSGQTRQQIPDFVRTVRDHEVAHVDQITAVIKDLGGDPVEAAEYDFGYESASDFLEVAAALENTGVAAYAGAGPDIESRDLVAAALSILSVEARHAAHFNFVNGEPPAPDAFDEALPMDEVLEIAGQFIVSE